MLLLGRTYVGFYRMPLFGRTCLFRIVCYCPFNYLSFSTLSFLIVWHSSLYSIPMICNSPLYVLSYSLSCSIVCHSPVSTIVRSFPLSIIHHCVIPQYMSFPLSIMHHCVIPQYISCTNGSECWLPCKKIMRLTSIQVTKMHSHSQCQNDSDIDNILRSMICIFFIFSLISWAELSFSTNVIFPDVLLSSPIKEVENRMQQVVVIPYFIPPCRSLQNFKMVIQILLLWHHQVMWLPEGY